MSQRLGVRLRPMSERLRTRLLAPLLIVVWLANIADFLLTRRSIALGQASEGNLALGLLMHTSGLLAFVVKVALVTVGIVLLWRLRAHRAALLGSAALVVLFAALVTYQALWVRALGG
jgi:hypothetical protein